MVLRVRRLNKKALTAAMPGLVDPRVPRQRRGWFSPDREPRGPEQAALPSGMRLPGRPVGRIAWAHLVAGRALRRRAMTPSKLAPWSWFLMSGAVIIGVYFALSADSSYGVRVSKVAAYCLVSGAAAAALVLGLRRNRPDQVRPWLWFLAGQMIYFVADCTFYVRHDLLGLTAYPSISDFLYLARYPFIVIALVLFIRRRTPGRDRPALLDAAILGIGAATLVWVFLLNPQIQNSGGPWLARAVSLAFPTLDLAVLVVSLRLLIGTGVRSRSFY